MSFCNQAEASWRRDKVAHKAWRTRPSAVIAAYEREQAWRSLGELAIRVEMERRLAYYVLHHTPHVA